MNAAVNMDAARNSTGIFSSLCAGGYSVRLRGFSALDRYLELSSLPFLWAETNADIAVLARFIDKLRFPGVEIADGAVDTPEGTCYFRCLDGDEQKENYFSFPLLSFGFDWQTKHFLDPQGIYPLLRTLLWRISPKVLRDKESHSDKENEDAVLLSFEAALNPSSLRNIVHDRRHRRYRLIMDASLILSRYDFGSGISRYIAALADSLRNGPSEPPPGPEIERAFLCCLMLSSRPDRGLELLKRSGFLSELWPELACLDDVDHSKEFHPEGNVWKHTLETFRHRKNGNGGAFDLRLSLGLLLHDSGKPVSASFGNNRFDGHAELGARAAARFLERLEFDASFIQDIFYLVKNHMLPAALKRLPLAKTGEIMTSPLFPTLMELYRCDESSSFKGLETYYENSAAYQTYLKNIRNPYRSADGKKIGARLKHDKR